MRNAYVTCIHCQDSFLELTAENQQLKDEKDKLRKNYENFIYGNDGHVADMLTLQTEIKQLKAKLHELAKDKIRQYTKANMHLFEDKQSQTEYCEVSGAKLDPKPERKPHNCL